jgi:tetratricopeptide (TPR) repeat protein
VFLRDTQFFLPDAAHEAAGKIVTHFLVEVRDEYLKIPALGIPLVANRVEEVLTLVRSYFERLDIPIPAAPPQPSLQIDRPKTLTRERLNLLLRPYNEFIGVIGRDPEMGALDLFCNHPAAFRWKVMTGDGGVGKTRLALELAKRLKDSGWCAGFLSAAALASFVQHDEFPRWAPLVGMLIVVDYAASKTEDLKRLLEQCGRWGQEPGGAIRLRLLLLEREAVPESGWLHGLLGSTEGLLRDQIQDALEPIMEVKAPGRDDPNAAMQDILRATFDAWSRLPGQSKTPPFPALDQAALRELRRQTEGRPLFLQMAALRACAEGDTSGLARWGREDLLHDAVERERQYVEKRFGAGATRTLLAERGIAFLTFTGPMSKDEPRWLKLLAADAHSLGFPHAQPGEVSEDVASLLSESQEGNAARIEPLGPDLLAEAFAVTVFSGRAGSPALAMKATLECAGPLQAWGSWLRATVDLYELPRLGIIESWLLTLVSKRAGPELDVVEGLIPKHSVALRRIAAAVGENQLGALAAGEKADQERARILNNLGAFYSELGRREEALRAAERASKIYERLAKQNPDAFEPDLALSLNNLGNRYSAVGRREEALGAAERASKIYRRLAKQNPDAFEPDLAASLNNLGNRYSALGKREEALGAAERAVEIRERLAKQNPDAFAPDLASSLNNLGIRYSALGRREEALRAAERAVEIRERLAKQNPDAFEPDLATSLGALGSVWRELNPVEAINAFRRGIEKLRRMFLRHPAAFAQLMAALLRDYVTPAKRPVRTPISNCWPRLSKHSTRCPQTTSRMLKKGACHQCCSHKRFEEIIHEFVPERPPHPPPCGPPSPPRGRGR